MQNKVRELWQAGRPVANGWLSIGNSFAAEIVAAQGYDAVTIDLQHGMIGITDALPMLQALRACGVAALVRVPTLESGIIGKVLDAGAVGVICPLIDTAAEAAALVAAVRYPPLGGRSYGPARAAIVHGVDYWSTANAEIICLAMIETRSGMDNLEAIVKTPGLDGVYIGPSDLTLGLENGRLPPGFDRREPQMIAAIRNIIDTAHAAGIKACLHNGSSDYAAQAVGWGADLVTLLNDARLLAAAAAASVDRFRELTGPRQ